MSEIQSPGTDIEVQIRGLMLDPVTNMPIVVLKDVASELVLPIWVGVFEANAIALELEKAALPRPMTHDLLRNIARGLNGMVTKVVVSDLRDDTFFATIWMRQGEDEITLDARPSDAIALALRWDCPIYVAERLLGAGKTVISGTTQDSDEVRKWLENLNVDEAGGYTM